MLYALLNKRFRVFMVFVALVLGVCLVGYAQNAEENPSFSLAIEPSSLTAPGNVTISVRVSNTGAQDINTPLSLYDPDGKIVTTFGDGGSLFPLKAGEFKTWQGTYNVTQKQLDEGKLIFTLHYNKADAAGNVTEITLPASDTLTFTGEKVDLKVNRTIFPEVVRRNEQVTVLYELVNQGNVKLTNIEVTENSSISAKKATIAELVPGASEKVTFTKQAGAADLTSSARITYRKEGSRTNLRINVASVVVPLARPALNYTLTADKTQVDVGETATLTLTIRNAGNISYSKVNVTDPILGEVFTNLQIPAGQTLEKTREVTVNETTTYQFTLNLEDNTGKTQAEKVPDLKISAYAQGQMLRLSLVLTSDTETISSLPGDVRFKLVVTNDSNNAAKEIKILHGTTDIYTINELAPGKSSTITRDVRLSQQGKYQFTANAIDSQDNPVSFTSNTLDIAYVQPTSAPTRKLITTLAPLVTLSPVPADAPQSTSSIRDALFIVALALGVLFGIALILLLVSSIARAKSRIKSNAAYDSFQVSPTRDYTAPASKQSEQIDSSWPEQDVSAKEAPVPLPHEKYLAKSKEIKVDTLADDVKASLPNDNKDHLDADPVHPEPKSEIQPVSEEGAYSLVRENEEANETEKRIRRVVKHTKPDSGGDA